MKLKIVVCGLGKQSIKMHLPALMQSQQFELVGVCDSDASHVAHISSHYNVYGTTDCDDLIATQNFDVALISVPHNCYLPLITKLAAAGKHIIKEKPLATTLHEASQLVQILKSSNTYLGVTVQRRFDPTFQMYHHLKDRIGKIYSFEGRYTKNIAALDIGWRASKERAGGGTLMDMGYHFIDLLVWYFGVPKSVSARLSRGNRSGQLYDVEDTAHLVFDFDSPCYDEKLIGHFVISRVYPTNQEFLRIFGTQGSIELSPGLVRLIDLKGNESERFEQTRQEAVTALEQLDFFASEIKQCVTHKRDGHSAHLPHVAIIEAAYQSDRLGISCNPNTYLQTL